MASWVGPTVAISLALIALSYLGMAWMMIRVVKEAREKSGTMVRELTELRHDLAPTLASINHFGDAGSEVIEQLRDEVGEVIKTSQGVRRGVHKAVRQAENRLADLDALLEVATDEAESALMDASAAIQSVRTSAGLLSHVGRLLAPRDEEQDEEDEEEFEEELEEEVEADLDDLDDDALEDEADDDEDVA
ncbi:MAG TPA: hypothetical protein VFN22_13400 [Gemmatimonadales bacterium]|nr:hypothetical protein [Gemmatimonadales bacterium]